MYITLPCNVHIIQSIYKKVLECDWPHVINALRMPVNLFFPFASQHIVVYASQLCQRILKDQLT